MARRIATQRRRFEWARSTGTFAGNYLAVDLFEQTRVAFPTDANFAGVTVVAVKGYLRASNDTIGPIQVRAGIRTCDKDDILDQDPQHGPSNPTVTQVSPNTGAWNDWMGYFPALLQGGTNVVGEATWNHAASPWAIDVQSRRKVEERNTTLGLFMDSPEATTLWHWDLSIGVKLP